MHFLYQLLLVDDTFISPHNIDESAKKTNSKIDTKKVESVHSPFALTRAEAFKASKLNKNGASFFVAIAVLLCFVSFCIVIPLNYWKINDHYILSSILLVVVEIYLYTGIFITAHDAMHSLILPSYPLINKYIGILCVQLYAFFDYNLLLKAHNKHHSFVGELYHDPDYHEYKYDKEWKIVIVWFCGFMKEYLSIKPLLFRAWFYIIFTLYYDYSHFHINLFWSLPSILSSMQLWYFGTYLVHRRNYGNYNGNNIENEHNAYTDYSRSIWYHIFTCYCFGIHYEHHKYPYIPWWYLPFIYKQQ